MIGPSEKSLVCLSECLRFSDFFDHGFGHGLPVAKVLFVLVQSNHNPERDVNSSPVYFAVCSGEMPTFKKVEPNCGGQNADYIPQLAKVNPDQFSISITTTDGQHYSIGDSDTQFCIQLCSKPISYLLALDKFGEEYVHKHVLCSHFGSRHFGSGLEHLLHLLHLLGTCL